MNSADDKFLEEISAADPIKAAKFFSALLTVPDLQSNCIRLEAAVHLCLACGQGKWKPNTRTISDWYTKMGDTHYGYQEDPCEDVFVGSVFFFGKQYRIFEGVWTSSSFFLQRFLKMLEEMPEAHFFKQLKSSARAILSISDIVVDRAHLESFHLGSEIKQDRLGPGILNNLTSIKRRISISEKEMSDSGIQIPDLEPFIFNFEDRRTLRVIFTSYDMARVMKMPQG